jgi:RimJ/RimL family protein N-acetyltransferase
LAEQGLPVGAPLPDWEPCPRPDLDSLIGQYCRLVPLKAGLHASSLFEAYGQDQEGLGWTYLPYGSLDDPVAFRSWVDKMVSHDDPLFLAILDETGNAVGIASYLRINPDMGSIEVGHIHYSLTLQRTPAATEAMYLLARRAFDELGYRRYEWRCDDLNAASRLAGERLGFVYEGTFRQDRIYKGRSRDTAWYSITDGQ